ncbi:hypothetical protein HZ994_09555 [Akkermansiaceae bacterium]|nr:hypothetical protein HZ994_09555 [Akkermansiaceae bacterium]
MKLELMPNGGSITLSGVRQYDLFTLATIIVRKNREFLAVTIDAIAVRSERLAIFLYM